jgi:hypothetical protein
MRVGTFRFNQDLIAQHCMEPDNLFWKSAKVAAADTLWVWPVLNAVKYPRPIPAKLTHSNANELWVNLKTNDLYQDDVGRFIR